MTPALSQARVGPVGPAAAAATAPSRQRVWPGHNLTSSSAAAATAAASSPVGRRRHERQRRRCHAARGGPDVGCPAAGCAAAGGAAACGSRRRRLHSAQPSSGGGRGGRHLLRDGPPRAGLRRQLHCAAAGGAHRRPQGQAGAAVHAQVRAHVHPRRAGRARPRPHVAQVGAALCVLAAWLRWQGRCGASIWRRRPRAVPCREPLVRPRCLPPCAGRRLWCLKRATAPAPTASPSAPRSALCPSTAAARRPSQRVPRSEARLPGARFERCRIWLPRSTTCPFLRFTQHSDLIPCLQPVQSVQYT